MNRLLSWDKGKLLARVVALGVSHGFIPWRWFLAGVVFVLAVVAGEDSLRFGFQDFKVYRPVDLWDLFPGLLHDQFFLLWLFGFGFLLLVGDSYLRERARGGVTLCTLRLPSRAFYWLGKMGAMGVLALFFVGLGLVITLLVGLFVAPPSGVPLFAREGLPGMYPLGGLFVPAYLLVLAGYTAWALWLVGCAVMLLSVFIPRKATVPAAVIAWATVSMPWVGPRSYSYARLLFLDYFLSIAKHDDTQPVSWQAYFTMGAVAAVLMAAAGSWRLRREEL